MPLMAAMAVFALMLVIFLGVYVLVVIPRQEIRNRLSRYLTSHQEQEASYVPEVQRRGGWRSLVSQAGVYFEWAGWSRSVEHRLIQAGLPLRGAEFMAICTIMAVFGGLILLVLSGGALLSGVAGALAGYLLPVFWLKLKIANRVKAFNSELGDALTLIANSLRTGYSFLQSLEMVAREMPPPISEEFARTLKEMNLGVTTEEALNNLARRITSDDLDLVITAVLIQRQVGGNLAEVLDNISGTIRARIKIKGEIKTLTAQGRISGLIICALPVVLGFMLYWINPGYVSLLFQHPLGILLLGVAVLSEFIGIFAISKIVNIEV
ncbi:MAG: Type secretion system domain protein [Firmicutes bacterium]|nr:Type secretion system domain protein [Bacillota bacterium]